MDICVRGISIPVGALLGIFLRFLDLALFHDFLALDHASAAVLAGILPLFTGGTAARAVIVVDDLRADDLFLGLLVGSET